ncbi:hypothetical protein HYU10_02870 [Candidatus Woesearchaeota archaeon]|nr:hypothetical protein [Candidatus Woesearchaeota archaeon]MBI2130689.1 hypothetical protein [Candidatus Woesearchaeota archaeon]MBI2660884.1 hypothetical protein [Candidatus Woesearchaeota archaeon]
MPYTNPMIETGVDKLVKLVKQSGKISVAEAAKILGLSTTIITEWADFLEEEGIISIEYNLTQPFLVERKLTKKEVEVKSKEFHTQKDIFVRKAEISLGFLQRQAQDIKNLKGEFDKLRQKSGFELDAVKGDLQQLENYERMREGLVSKILEQKTESERKLSELTQKIAMEEKKLRDALSGIREEQGMLSHERVEAKSLEKYEILLGKKLSRMKSLVARLESRLVQDNEAVQYSGQKVRALRQILANTQKSIRAEKALIEPLLAQSRWHEKKIVQLQKSIVDKIRKKAKQSPNAKNLAAKIDQLLKKKFAALQLVDKVNIDRGALEKELSELIKKAKAFQLTSNASDTSKKIVELESKFRNVEQKRKEFDEEYERLKSILK